MTAVCGSPSDLFPAGDVGEWVKLVEREDTFIVVHKSAHPERATGMSKIATATATGGPADAMHSVRGGPCSLLSTLPQARSQQKCVENNA